MIDKYGLSLVTPQTGEPVSVQDLDNHLRIVAADNDVGAIQAYITAAREYFETVTHRQLMQAQYCLYLDQFPGRRVDEYRPPGWRYGVIRMPKPPLISVDLIQYIDVNQALQTLATNQYQTAIHSEPGRCLPAPFQVWPVTDPYSAEAVQVTFTCGYTSAALVPARFIQAIKLLVGHLWEHREATTEQALTTIPYGLASFIRSSSYGEYS